MSDDFSQFERMKSEGEAASAAYLRARDSGLDTFATIRMLRQVFGLSLIEAKEVTVVADGIAPSLDAHQERLAAVLKAAFEEDKG